MGRRITYVKELMELMKKLEWMPESIVYCENRECFLWRSLEFYTIGVLWKKTKGRKDFQLRWMPWIYDELEKISDEVYFKRSDYCDKNRPNLKKKTLCNS